LFEFVDGGDEELFVFGFGLFELAAPAVVVVAHQGHVRGLAGLGQLYPFLALFEDLVPF
jgi:hypothetical protein